MEHVADADAAADEAILESIGGSLASSDFKIHLALQRDVLSRVFEIERGELLIVVHTNRCGNGPAHMRQLRQSGLRLPIVVLDAERISNRCVDMLNAGADEYLALPVAPAVLLARCRALVRRHRLGMRQPIEVGRLTVDLVHREARIGADPLALTYREWSILECLADVRAPVSNEQLRSRIIGHGESVSGNAIEVYVSRLRTKLMGAAEIRSVRHVGYELTAPCPKNKGGGARKLQQGSSPVRLNPARESQVGS